MRMISRPAVEMINVNEVLDIACVRNSSARVKSVRGSMNCINPVIESGIFPVAYENISKGMMEAQPASQIK